MSSKVGDVTTLELVPFLSGTEIVPLDVTEIFLVVFVVGASSVTF